MIKAIVYSSLISLATVCLADPGSEARQGHVLLKDQIMPVVQPEEDINGFIACYSHDNEQPSYSVGNSIHVKGFVAMKGAYKGRVFHPQGYLNQDISPVNSEPSQLCQSLIPSCRNNHLECWAGGDTGGYFPILMWGLDQ